MPASPFKGGSWEAAVKFTKFNLKRVADRSCSLSDDPQDVAALTPAYFLIGEVLVQPLVTDVSTVPTNRLELWQLTQKLKHVAFAKAQ